MYVCIYNILLETKCDLNTHRLYDAALDNYVELGSGCLLPQFHTTEMLVHCTGTIENQPVIHDNELYPNIQYKGLVLRRTVEQLLWNQLRRERQYTDWNGQKRTEVYYDYELKWYLFI